jgi:hypothetical protein
MAAFPGNARVFSVTAARAELTSASDAERCRAAGLRRVNGEPAPRDNEYVRRAIEVALRSLAWLPGTDVVCRLREEGERLLAEVESWSAQSPSPEIREDAMRRVSSMHLGAVAAMQAVRAGR